jgi:hypothetical protein
LQEGTDPPDDGDRYLIERLVQVAESIVEKDISAERVSISEVKKGQMKD